jgi:hypothetical protein
MRVAQRRTGHDPAIVPPSPRLMPPFGRHTAEKPCGRVTPMSHPWERTSTTTCSPKLEIPPRRQRHRRQGCALRRPAGGSEDKDGKAAGGVDGIGTTRAGTSDDVTSSRRMFPSITPRIGSPPLPFLRQEHCQEGLAGARGRTDWGDHARCGRRTDLDRRCNAAWKNKSNDVRHPCNETANTSAPRPRSPGRPATEAATAQPRQISLAGWLTLDKVLALWHFFAS